MNRLAAILALAVAPVGMLIPAQHIRADSHGLPCNARYVDVGAYYDMRHGFYVTDWWVFDKRGYFCKQFYTRHLDPIPDPGSPVNHPPQPPHKG